MATIKSYTDIEQSRKLAEILPLESADMEYLAIKENGLLVAKIPFVKDDSEVEDSAFSHIYNRIDCWSLAALISVLPVIIGDVLSENALRLRMDKSETEFTVWYENLDSGLVEEGLDIIKSNTVDTCYEMILKLHELNLL